MKLIQKQVNKLFGINTPDENMCSVREVDKSVAKNIPQQKWHVFDRSILTDLMSINWHEGDEPPLLYGSTGAGKTSVAMQLAARLNIPVWPETCHEEMELQTLYGHYVLKKDGSMEWMDGPLTHAARNGGICLLNEIDRLRPEVLVGLNDVLEFATNNGFTIAAHHGEFVSPKPGFNIVCTSNTNLCGDMTGSYGTAKIHDKSVLDRFGRIIEVPYLDPEDEVKILAEIFSDFDDDKLKLWFADEDIKVGTGTEILEGENVTREAFLKAMVEVANSIRSQSADGGNISASALERTMSTRVLQRWAKLCITYRPATMRGLSVLHYSIQRAFTNGCRPSSKEAVHRIIETTFGVQPSLGST